jgi:hypothetical protein
MALLVKEQKALDTLEQSLVTYYAVMLGEELVIDTYKTVEERLLFLSVHINGLL